MIIYIVSSKVTQIYETLSQRYNNNLQFNPFLHIYTYKCKMYKKKLLYFYTIPFHVGWKCSITQLFGKDGVFLLVSVSLQEVTQTNCIVFKFATFRKKLVGTVVGTRVLVRGSKVVMVFFVVHKIHKSALLFKS